MNEIVRRPWKAVMLLLAVFVAGGLVGGAMAKWEPSGHGHGRDANPRKTTPSQHVYFLHRGSS